MKKKERLEKIKEIGKEIRENNRFLNNKKYIQHGNTTIWKHVHDVAEMSLFLDEKLHLKSDKKKLIKGALLHDFFDYDWHNKKEKKPLFKMHGFTHPIIAKENAEKEFGIDNKVANIIESHMWPLTLTHFPKSREAILVNIADTIVSIKETLRKNN